MIQTSLLDISSVSSHGFDALGSSNNQTVSSKQFIKVAGPFLTAVTPYKICSTNSHLDLFVSVKFQILVSICSSVHKVRQLSFRLLSQSVCQCAKFSIPVSICLSVCKVFNSGNFKFQMNT